MSTMSSNQNDSALSQTQYTEEEKEFDEHLFIQELKSLSWEHYFYQKDKMTSHSFRSGLRDLAYEHFLMLRPAKFEFYDRHGGPIIKAKDLVGVKHYSGPELNQITKSFSRLICNTLFGSLYKGTIEKESQVRDVIVKTWNFPYLTDYPGAREHHTTRLCDELSLLRDPEIKSHPNVVKLIGFHCDRGLAVVYEGGQKELLHSILASDEFLWNYRMEVAIEIAGLLKTFHDKNLVHGGVNSVNILVDEAYRPVVFDFNCFSYLENLEELYIPHVRMRYYFHAKWLEGPRWSMGNDIFAFGILLVELICKQGYDNMLVNDMVSVFNYQVRDTETSLVHHSFYIDEKVGLEITKLAINCLKVNSDVQPTIKEVVEELTHLVHSTPPNKQQKMST